MIKEALEYVVNLRKPEIVEIGDAKYTDKTLSRIKSPTVSSFKVSTLTANIDYIRENKDGINLNETIIQIESPISVKLFSTINCSKERNYYIESNAIIPRFNFDSFHDAESFNIALQSKFTDVGDKAAILEIIGNLREENVQSIGDDGTSQQVTVKAGIATVAKAVVPNPVELAPYRTFREVEQPISKFIFRMKQGGYCALFEADGGAWENEAMLNIKEYLQEQLIGTGVAILA